MRKEWCYGWICRRSINIHWTFWFKSSVKTISINIMFQGNTESIILYQEMSSMGFPKGGRLWSQLDPQEISGSRKQLESGEDANPHLWMATVEVFGWKRNWIQCLLAKSITSQLISENFECYCLKLTSKCLIDI